MGRIGTSFREIPDTNAAAASAERQANDGDSDEDIDGGTGKLRVDVWVHIVLIATSFRINANRFVGFIFPSWRRQQ